MTTETGPIFELLHAAASYSFEAASRDNDASRINQSTALERNRPFIILRPRLFPDGNQWCALLGEDLQSGVCAFGDTPAAATLEFDVQWLTAQAGMGGPKWP